MYNKNKKRYNNGGNLIEGAVSGAIAGSSLGPWGAVGGAGLGLLTTQLMNNNNSQYQGYNNFNIPVGDNPEIQFREGGQLNEFNGGGTHEQNPLGGIPVGGNQSVESGETEFTPENYVFSDRLSINKKVAKDFGYKTTDIGLTFADVSKKINDRYSKRSNDSIDEESKNRELRRLMITQEALKESKGMNAPQGAQLANGGPIYASSQNNTNQTIRRGDSETPSFEEWSKMFMNSDAGKSGIKPTMDMYISAFNQEYLDRAYRENQRINNNAWGPNEDMGLGQQIPTTEYNTDFVQGEDMGQMESRQDPQGFRPSPFSQIGRIAPIAYNLYQGLKPEDRLNAGDYKTTDRLEAQQLNIDPIVRRNNETYQAQQNAIRSASGGSGGTYLANLAQAQLNKQKADSNAYIAKSEYDNRMLNQTDQYNIGLDQRNRQIQNQVDDWNMRSRANRVSHLSDAAHNVASLSEANRQTGANAYGYSQMAPMYQYMFNNFLNKNNG